MPSLLALLVLFAALAAPPHLVVATDAGRVVAGSTASLFVDVLPMPGIHVYAPGAASYQPIALKLVVPAGVTLRRLKYPKAERIVDPANQQVPVYQKPFRLEQQVAIDRSAAGRPLVVSGTLEYQACDDAVCYRPESAPVRWTLQVERRGK